MLRGIRLWCGCRDQSDQEPPGPAGGFRSRASKARKGDHIMSKHIFMIIGSNNSGKTTVQKHILHILSGEWHNKLRSNQCHLVRLTKKHEKIFVGNQCWQEIRPRLKLDCWFKLLKDNTVNLAFIPSRYNDIDRMAQWFRSQEYPCHICGIFLENNPTKNDPIMTAPWLDEYWILENPKAHPRSQEIAKTIVQRLILASLE